MSQFGMDQLLGSWPPQRSLAQSLAVFQALLCVLNPLPVLFSVVMPLLWIIPIPPPQSPFSQHCEQARLNRFPNSFSLSQAAFALPNKELFLRYFSTWCFERLSCFVSVMNCTTRLCFVLQSGPICTPSKCCLLKFLGFPWSFPVLVCVLSLFSHFLNCFCLDWKGKTCLSLLTFPSLRGTHRAT